MDKENKKSILKSIRMTEATYRYVDKQPGDGFNQKFEHMVYRSMREEKDLKQRIAEQQKKLAALKAEVATYERVRNVLADVMKRVDDLIATVS